MRRVLTALIVTTCFAASLFSAATAPARASGVGMLQGSAATTPARGAFFGAYVMPTGRLSFCAAVKAFETKLGRKLAIVNKYHDWSLATTRTRRR